MNNDSELLCSNKLLDCRAMTGYGAMSYKCGWFMALRPLQAVEFIWQFVFWPWPKWNVQRIMAQARTNWVRSPLRVHRSVRPPAFYVHKPPSPNKCRGMRGLPCHQNRTPTRQLAESWSCLGYQHKAHTLTHLVSATPINPFTPPPPLPPPVLWTHSHAHLNRLAAG